MKQLGRMVAIIVTLSWRIGAAIAGPIKPMDAEISPTAVTLQTVWRQTLDAPFMDAVFEEVEMTVKEAKTKGWMNVKRQAENEKVKVPQLRVGIVQRDPDEHREEEIRFYDTAGRLTKTIPVGRTRFERVVKSPKGNYLVISTWPGHEAVGGGMLLDQTGQVIWHEKEGPVPIKVSDSGIVLAIDPGEDASPDANAYVIDRSGAIKVKIVNPFATASSGSSQAQFTEDGTRAIVGFNKWPDQTTIQSVTPDGQTLWEKTLPFVSFRMVPDQVQTHSEQGTVAIGERLHPGGRSEKFIFKLSVDGQLVWERTLNQGGGLNLDFYSSQNRVCIISPGGGVIFFIDATSGTIIHEYRETWSQRGSPVRPVVNRPWPSQLKILGGYAYVIGEYRNADREWYASALYVFNVETGDLLSKQEYPQARLLLREVAGQPLVINFDTKEAIRVLMTSGLSQK